MSRSRRLNRSTSAKARRRPRAPLRLPGRRRGGPRPGVYARRRPPRGRALTAAAIGGGIGLATLTGVLLAAVLLVSDGSRTPEDGVAEANEPAPSVEPSTPARERGEPDEDPSPTPEPSPGDEDEDDTADETDSAEGSATEDGERGGGGAEGTTQAASDSSQPGQQAGRDEESASEEADGGGHSSPNPQHPPANSPSPSDPPESIDPQDNDGDDDCPWWRPTCW